MQGVADAEAEVVATVSTFAAVAAEGYVAEEMVFIRLYLTQENWHIAVEMLLCYQRK